MTTELAVHQPELPTAADMNAAALYAERLAGSMLLPKQYFKQPSNVLYAIEYGRMIGLAPMAAIVGVHVVEGKPTASAALVSALVRRAGHKLRVWGNATRATCQIVRSDDPDYVFEVTWELRKNQHGNPNAEDAGLLGKAVWKNYAASMLKARAITQCARDACEEALMGMHYTPEELGAEVDAEGDPVAAPVQPQRPERSKGQQEDEFAQPTPSDDIPDAEIVPDQPEPGQPQESDAYVTARMKVLHTLIAKKFGPKTDDERHASFSRFCKRPIASAKDMTPGPDGEREAYIALLEKQPDFVLTEEAVVAAAEQLAEHAEPPAVAEEERLRDLIESAGDPTAVESAMSAVFDAETAGSIGGEAFGRLQSAGSERGKRLRDLASAAQERRAKQKATAA